MGGLGSNTKLGGLQFRRCLRNFILGAGDHVPVEKAASVSDCGAKLLTKNCTADLLKPQKFAEESFSNDSELRIWNISGNTYLQSGHFFRQELQSDQGRLTEERKSQLLPLLSGCLP